MRTQATGVIPRLALLLVAAAAPAAAAPAAAGEFFPLRDTAVREFIDLSGRWHFRRDPEDVGTRERWFAPDADLSGWQRVAVPGVWEMAPGQVKPDVYTGKGWFRRTAAVPAGWDGSLRLWFLGAMHVTDVWVNGRYHGARRGGYTPFSFDVTETVAPGATAVIVVRVDNTLDGQTVPKQRTGWLSYGGIYREVYLACLPAARVEDPAVRVRVAPDNGQARVAVSGEFYNGSGRAFAGPLRLTLAGGGQERAAEKTLRVPAGGRALFSFELEVAQPRLWHPEDPYLHDLRLSWASGGPAEIRMRAGLREIRVEDGRILLNNRPLWLQGFGQHEDQLGFGPVISRERRRAELLLMKREYRANTIRTGHYPNHPHLYDLCDELGLLVCTEIPAWQIDRQVLESDACWERWLEPQLTAMVRTLRNHPSVAFWGVSNEVSGTHGYFKRARGHIRALDPTRPVTAVLASAGDPGAAPFIDFWARNFHYGWYHSTEVYALRSYLSRVLRESRGMPIWVAEIGGLSRRGRFTGGYGDQSRGSETYLDMILRFGLQYSSTETDRIAGVSVWTWTDFHRPGRDGMRNHHGIFDLEGRPKLAAWTVRNLFDGELRAYICEEHAFAEHGSDWEAEIRFFNPGERPWPEVRSRWALLRGAEVLARGEKTFAAAAGERAGLVERVSWPVPEGGPDGLHALVVEFSDASDTRLHANVSYFDAGANSRPGVLEVSAREGGGPAAGAWLELGGLRLPVYPLPGLLMPLPEGAYRFAFGSASGRRLEREFTVKSGERTVLELEFD